MQNLDDQSLGVLEVNSVTLGYRALDGITRETKVKVVEAAIHGSDLFLILLQGPTSEVRKAESLAQTLLNATGTMAMRDREVISPFNEKLLPTFYSLHTSQLQASLLVVETETISGLFCLSQRLLQVHGLEPIEIRSLRGGAGTRGLGYFTGGASKCAQAADDARTILRNLARRGTIEVIEQPNEAFRAFFDIQN